MCGLSLFGGGICDTFRVVFGKFVKCEEDMIKRIYLEIRFLRKGCGHFCRAIGCSAYLVGHRSS